MQYKNTLIASAIGLTLISGVALAAIPDTHIVSQKKRTYAPGQMSIQAGEKIKIMNDDMFLHHAFIDAPNMEYDSGSMEEGDAVEILFKEKGVYDVMCAIHPKMNLKVTVK